MSRMVRYVVAAALSLPLTASPALAQQAPENARACRADVEKFCKDVQPGGGRVAQCMKQHESELSDACKSAAAAAKERRQERKGTATQSAQ